MSEKVTNTKSQANRKITKPCKSKKVNIALFFKSQKNFDISEIQEIKKSENLNIWKSKIQIVENSKTQKAKCKKV